MRYNAEHFIYSLYPYQGYGITASSPGIDKERYYDLLSPLPVEFGDVKKLGKVWSLRILRDEVMITLLTLGGIDEHKREGMYSHNIIIGMEDYFKTNALPSAFEKCFIYDSERKGELAPLLLDTEQMEQNQGIPTLEGMSAGTVKKVLHTLIKGTSLTLICKGRDTEEMVRIFSAFLGFLPQNRRAIPFITAPVSVGFKSKFGNRYKVTLRQDSPLLLTEKAQEFIDIDKEYKFPRTRDSIVKTAHDLFDRSAAGEYKGTDKSKTEGSPQASLKTARYPAISSQLLEVNSYDSFKSTSINILKNSLADPSMFQENLEYIVNEARTRFKGQVLDSVLFFLKELPQNKSAIVQCLKKEDLVLGSFAQSSTEMRQSVLANAERILQILNRLAS